MKVVWELPKAEILRWSNNLVVGIAVLEGGGKLEKEPKYRKIHGIAGRPKNYGKMCGTV